MYLIVRKSDVSDTSELLERTNDLGFFDIENDKIQWACSTSISTNSGEPETLKEGITRPNGHLWKIYAISELTNFLSRKAWIPTKRSVIKSKGRKPITVKCVFNSKEEAGGLIRRKSRNVVKGYMQVRGFDLT